VRIKVSRRRRRDQLAIETALNLMDRAAPLAKHADEPAAAILPAARNEIFSAMRDAGSNAATAELSEGPLEGVLSDDRDAVGSRLPRLPRERRARGLGLTVL
jgi:hypothetical protein